MPIAANALTGAAMSGGGPVMTKRVCAQGQTPPPSLVEAAAGAQSIYASTLPRAVETAKAAAPGRELILDSIFVEAPLPPPQMPGRFTARTWGVFARCSWWLGHARGRETRGQAERRAEQAADQLVEAARHGTVALFAHGWFNRMLRPGSGAAWLAVCSRWRGLVLVLARLHTEKAALKRRSGLIASAVRACVSLQRQDGDRHVR
jgi:hypothetical protein